MNTGTEQREIKICSGPEDLAEQCAQLFARLVKDAVAKNDRVYVAFSGGSTPKLLYDRLVKDDLKNSIAWEKIEAFVSDDRCVPHASQESNFGNAKRQLFTPVGLKAEQLHPTCDQDRDPEKSALEYDRIIRNLVPMDDHGLPRFNIIFLGIGPDGHTASLFPGTEALDNNERLVVSNHVEKVRAERITFTYPLINNADNVIFFVAGVDKSKVLAEIVEKRAKEYPASHVSPQGTLHWVIDREAASHLASRD